jgi:hypothetical protein
MQTAFRDATMIQTGVYEWCCHFKERRRCFSISRNEELVAKVHDLA